VCTFNDRNMIISESLKSYMYQSCEYGIFQWTSSNNFMPKSNLTQAQAIAVVVRSLSSEPINESWYAPWYKGYADALASKKLWRKWYTTKDMVAFKTTSITRWQLGELLYSVMYYKTNK
jgi:hypothetical protein